MGYDAKKAETFNKLRQAGISEDQALTQAGIGDADIGDYALGSNGQIGPMVIGSGKVAGVDYEKYTPAELNDAARFDKGLQSVNFEEKGDSLPDSKKPMTYTTTSTSTVSGGGSTTIVAGPKQPTAASQAYANAYDAKNAEYNEFVKNNPSDFARKKQGLPPLTAEEAQQRQDTLNKLTAEKAALKNSQVDAESPGQPTTFSTPNTTTTTQTVTTQVVSAKQPVDYSTDAGLNNQVSNNLAANNPAVAQGGTNNQKTAAQWGQVVDNLDAQKKDAQTQLTASNNVIKNLATEKAELSAQLAAADAAGDETAKAAIQQQIDSKNQQIEKANVIASNLQSDITTYDQSLNNALTQQATAQSGPNSLNSTVGPASVNPGDPTAISATDTTVSNVSTSATPVDAGEDPYVSNGQSTIPLATASAAPVDAGEDPYVSNGESTIPPATASAAPVDGGEDPYVSNGESTIPLATASAAPVDAGEDPYVSNGESTIPLATASAAPVDAGEDPYVSNGQSTIEPIVIEESAAETNRLLAYEAETKAKLKQAQEQATIQQRFNQTTNADWRVRLRIAPDANYLYQDPSNTLLAPLKASDGIIFPYTPIINSSYSAKYDPYDLVHSNYRGYFYKSSQVSDINIQATFTAQDTTEAKYLLAVIHFFRSATKMFYGKDQQKGTPPPLVYLRGYGEYQYNDHPCLISNFQYNLPADVDYISVLPNNVGLDLGNRTSKVNSSPVSTISSAINRLSNLFNATTGAPGVPKGATGGPVDLGSTRQVVQGLGQTTYVPTKIELSITLLPTQTRSQVSKQFSAKEFSNGNLLKGGFW